MKITLHFILICILPWQIFILINCFYTVCLLEDDFQRTFRQMSESFAEAIKAKKIRNVFACQIPLLLAAPELSHNR